MFDEDQYRLGADDRSSFIRQNSALIRLGRLLTNAFALSAQTHDDEFFPHSSSAGILKSFQVAKFYR
jgi:hypothetical protein